MQALSFRVEYNFINNFLMHFIATCGLIIEESVLSLRNSMYTTAICIWLYAQSKGLTYELEYAVHKTERK